MAARAAAEALERDRQGRDLLGRQVVARHAHGALAVGEHARSLELEGAVGVVGALVLPLERRAPVDVARLLAGELGEGRPEVRAGRDPRERVALPTPVGEEEALAALGPRHLGVVDRAPHALGARPRGGDVGEAVRGRERGVAVAPLGATVRDVVRGRRPARGEVLGDARRLTAREAQARHAGHPARARGILEEPRHPVLAHPLARVVERRRPRPLPAGGAVARVAREALLEDRPLGRGGAGDVRVPGDLRLRRGGTCRARPTAARGTSARGGTRRSRSTRSSSSPPRRRARGRRRRAAPSQGRSAGATRSASWSSGASASGRARRRGATPAAP